MPNTTLAPPSQVETDVLKGHEALTECPECRIGNYTQLLYREDGRVMVLCGICERSRYYADAHTPPTA